MTSVCEACGRYIAREDLVVRKDGRFHRQCAPDEEVPA